MSELLAKYQNRVEAPHMVLNNSDYPKLAKKECPESFGTKRSRDFDSAENQKVARQRCDDGTRETKKYKSDESEDTDFQPEPSRFTGAPVQEFKVEPQSNEPSPRAFAPPSNDYTQRQPTQQPFFKTEPAFRSYSTEPRFRPFARSEMETSYPNRSPEFNTQYDDYPQTETSPVYRTANGYNSGAFPGYFNGYQTNQPQIIQRERVTFLIPEGGVSPVGQFSNRPQTDHSNESFSGFPGFRSTFPASNPQIQTNVSSENPPQFLHYAPPSRSMEEPQQKAYMKYQPEVILDEMFPLGSDDQSMLYDDSRRRSPGWADN